MMRRCALAVLVGWAVGGAGCVVSRTGPPTPAAGSESAAAANSGAERPVRAARGRGADADKEARGEAIRLPAYRVQEGAFSDFGMSVKTNFEVASGGHIQWMEVSGVEPGGSAAARGLAVGDRILALDTVAVTTLSKAAMLEALFQRKRGAQMRVLVMAQRDAFPRFVVVVAGRR